MEQKGNKIIVEFKCNQCNKNYSTSSGLWKHNSKYHSKIDSTIIPKKNDSAISCQQNVNIKEDTKKFMCSFCNSRFSYRQSKSKHQQTCKFKKEEKDIDEVEKLKEELENMKTQIAQLLKVQAKIHPKKLQKINIQLINNINNGTINNNFVKFGSVCYEKILSDSQIRKNILCKPYMSLEEGIKMTHFNKNHPEYNNIFITNMKDDLAYIFNGEKFVTVKKNVVLNELIDMHIEEINLSFEKNKKKLKPIQVERLEKFLEKINNEETKFKDVNDNNKKYPNYKAYKVESIKLLLYNESDSNKLKELQGIELFEKIEDSEVEE